MSVKSHANRNGGSLTLTFLYYNQLTVIATPALSVPPDHNR